MSKAKSQTIGCKVTSCAYNMSGCDCGLERIEVEPTSRLFAQQMMMGGLS